MRIIPCPLCASTGYSNVCERARHGTVYHCVECTACGFTYVNPEPTAEQLLALYDLEYTSVHQEVWHGLDDELNQGVRRRLRARGVPSLTATWGIVFRWGSVGHFLASWLAGWEGVTMLNVLGHLPNPRAVLRGIHGALRPGGVLYVVVPNVSFTRSLGAVRRLLGFRDVYMMNSPRFSQQGFDPPIHLSSFDARTLREMAAVEGYTIEWIGQAPVIGSANPIMQVSKRLVALVGSVLGTISFGRVQWGYSLAMRCSVPTASKAGGPGVRNRGDSAS